MNIVIVALCVLALVGFCVPYAIRSGYLGYMLLRVMSYRYYSDHCPRTSRWRDVRSRLDTGLFHGCANAFLKVF